jgi:hypothetical protein
MELIVSACYGSRSDRLAVINRSNREFHANREKAISSLLHDRRVAAAAYEQYQYSPSGLWISPTNASPLERLRTRVPYGQEILRVATIIQHFELADHPIARRQPKLQSARARCRRIRLGDREKPAFELVGELLKVLELQSSSARALWPHWIAKLRNEGCSPKDVPSSCGKQRRAQVKYDFYVRKRDPVTNEIKTEKNRRTMSFRTFENIVSATKRMSR